MAEIVLRVLDGADRGRVYENLPTPVTIGREEGNTIQLNDERVSRFHLKIQDDRDKVVLTDLESTNGTKVNGEDIQLRLLRYGDLIAVGRSVLLFGSRQQIARRLSELRGVDPEGKGTVGQADFNRSLRDAELGFELNWDEESEMHLALHALQPPELPERMSLGQAAQLSELLDYLHSRIRDLIASVKSKPSDTKGAEPRLSVELEKWQVLLDLQARLAGYLRAIGEPSSGD